MATLASNLKTLRAEIDARWPGRDRRSDGWIGDDKHRPPSDHIPDSKGVVRAIDVDVDGIDPHLVVRQAIRHPTTKYVIYNRTIWSRTRNFQSHRYTGSNPHTSHLHVSGLSGQAERDTQPWGVAAGGQNHLPGSRVLVYTPGNLMTGQDVAFVQRYIGPARCGPDDGRFGPRTAEGVRWYQQMRGMTPTGTVDQQTFAHMGVSWTGGS
jgi:peptidoglycan hydrolase-like protein with peptidoglycan-binding domain